MLPSSVPPEAGINERLCEFETLIEAAAGTVDYKDRRTPLCFRVLDRPAGVLTISLPEEIRARAARMSRVYSE